MKFRKRELGIFTLAVFGLALLLCYIFVIAPAVSKQRDLAEYVRNKADDLRQMLALQQEWKTFQDRRAEAESVLSRRGGQFTLLTYLEQVSREGGIDTKIQYIKPVSFPQVDDPMQPTGIEMRLARLDVKQLVDFLHRIEQSRNLLLIDKIKIQPTGSGKNRSLELTLQVTTYTLSENR